MISPRGPHAPRLHQFPDVSEDDAPPLSPTVMAKSRRDRQSVRWDCNTVSSILCYSSCQVIMITVNKAIMTVFGFKEITFLLFVQNVGLGCMLGFAYAALGYRPKISLNTFVASIPLCMLYICYLSTGLEALDRLSVPIYTLLKNSCPVFISVSENVLNTTQHNWQVIASLFVILLGVTVGQDSSGSWASQSGLVWMFLHMHFNVFYAVYAREFMARWQPSKLDSLACSCIVSIPLYSALMTFFTEWDDGAQQVRALYALHGVKFVLTFGISALMGAALTFSMFWLCQRTSALTLAVVGSFNKVPIVITSLVVFSGSQLSMRNAVGLSIVFTGSLFYARSSFFYPPKVVPSRWTRTNLAVMLVICMFITFSLSSLVRPADTWQMRQRKVIEDSMRGGQGTGVSTLVVKYPGSADVGVVDFVTHYLPSLAAVVRMSPDHQRIKLPLRTTPLRASTPRPLLMLDNTSSPLLHPELLPFVGSIFAEVLIAREDKPLLRVVRDPDWGGVLPEASTDTMLNTSNWANWNVLVMTSAIPPAPGADPFVSYVAIDSSTALCTPMHPSELHYLGSTLCGARQRSPRGHQAPRPPPDLNGTVELDSNELGTATSGALIPAAALETGGHSRGGHKDILLVRKDNNEWSDPVRRSQAQVGQGFYPRQRCRRILDGKARWPWGLRPLHGQQGGPGGAAGKFRLPRTVRSWQTRVQGERSSLLLHSPSLATCPVGTFDQETSLAEVTSVTHSKESSRSVRPGTEAQQQSEVSIVFFGVMAALSVAAVLLHIFAVSTDLASSWRQNSP